jgi:hypothetical protein
MHLRVDEASHRLQLHPPWQVDGELFGAGGVADGDRHVGDATTAIESPPRQKDGRIRGSQRDAGIIGLNILHLGIALAVIDGLIPVGIIAETVLLGGIEEDRHLAIPAHRLHPRGHQLPHQLVGRAVEAKW